MGPGSQSCSATLALSRAGKGHSRVWLNLAFLLTAGETNQADAGSGGAPQGYPAVLLPWCQGLAPCLWVQQVSAPELLCTLEWCWYGVHCSSLSFTDAQLRKQQFESWPLCDQAAVFNFSFFWSSVFFFFPILPASQACVAERKRLEGSSKT